MEALDSLLRAHPFLQEMQEEHIRFITGCAKNRALDRGDFLFREGESADHFYLVRTGRVALEIQVPGKGPVQIETIDGGGVLGGTFLFPPYRWGIDARVMEPTRVLELDGTCLRQKMETDTALGFALTRRLLRQVYQRLDRVRLQRLDLYKAAP